MEGFLGGETGGDYPRQGATLPYLREKNQARCARKRQKRHSRAGACRFKQHRTPIKTSGHITFFSERKTSDAAFS
jgi:hypothetical protein